MGCNAWIRKKIADGVSNFELCKMHSIFKLETGSTTTYDNYVRQIRRLRKDSISKIGQNIKSDTPHIIQDAEGPNLNIVSESHKIRTLEQLLAYTKVDLSTWRVKRHRVNSWGSHNNENFQVRAELELIDSDEGEDVSLFESLIETAKEYSPKYEKIEYPKKDRAGRLYEISLFDHHWGQLSWAPETGGQNYDCKIANKIGVSAFNFLLEKVKNIPLSKILLVVGNDFYNVDNIANTTTGGTPQSEDGRWKKTFPDGVQFWIEIIEKCSQIAPVDVLVVPGNHDKQRAFFLGVALECWFHNHKSVNIDNGPAERKYYEFGKNMICFTHASDEVKQAIPQLLPTERPEMWARTKYREVHGGHLHNYKMKAHQYIDEIQGIQVYTLPSMVPLNHWSAGRGYSGLRQTTAHLFHPEKGKEAIYFYHPEGEE